MAKHLTPFRLAIAIVGGALLFATIAQARVPTVALLNSDGTRLVAQQHGLMTVWNVAEGKIVTQIKNKEFFRGTLAKEALVGVTSDGLTVWNGSAFQTSLALSIPKTILTVDRAFLSENGSVAGAMFAIDHSAGAPNGFRLWETSTGKIITTVTLAQHRREIRILGMVPSIDGMLWLVFGDEQGKTRARWFELYQLTPRSFRAKRVWRIRDSHRHTFFSAAISSKKSWIALGDDQTLTLWNLKSREKTEQPLQRVSTLFPERLRTQVTEVGAYQLAFNHDETALAVLHASGIVGVSVWSIPTLQPIRWIRPSSDGPPMQIIWNRDNTLQTVNAGYSSVVRVMKEIEGAFQLDRAFHP